MPPAADSWPSESIATYWYEPSSSGSPSLPRHSPKPGAFAAAEIARRDAPPVALPPAVDRQRHVHPHRRADRGGRAGYGDVVAARRQQLVDLDLGLLGRRQERDVGGEVRHQPSDDVGVGGRRQGGGADAWWQGRRRHPGDRRRRGSRRGGGRWFRRGRRRRRRRWHGRRDRHRHGDRQQRRCRGADRRRRGHGGREGHGRRRREALLVAGDGVTRVTTPDRPGDDPGDHDERQHGDDDEAAAVRAFAGVGLFVGLLCGGFGLHGLVHSTSSDRRSRTYLAPFN